MKDFLYAVIILFITLPVRLVFFVLPFIPRWIAQQRKPFIDAIDPKQTRSIELDSFGYELIRSRLPKYLSWFDTPDQSLPGDMSIEAVRKSFSDGGYEKCSAYWIGVRNVLYGFSWLFGRPAPNYYALLTREQLKAGRFVSKSVKLWRFTFYYRHNIYRDWYSVVTKSQGFWAVPVITARYSK